MKIEKISSRVLLACITLIVVCFCAFMTIGYDNPVLIGNDTYNQPQLTDVILGLMYFLFVATWILVCWSVFCSIQSNRGNDPAATTGVPGGKIVMSTIGLLVASLVVGWISGLGESDFTASDGTVTPAIMVNVADMFCISMCILFVAASIAVAVSMTGIATKSATK